MHSNTPYFGALPCRRDWCQMHAAAEVHRKTPEAPHLKGVYTQLRPSWRKHESAPRITILWPRSTKRNIEKILMVFLLESEMLPRSAFPIIARIMTLNTLNTLTATEQQTARRASLLAHRSNLPRRCGEKLFYPLLTTLTGSRETSAIKSPLTRWRL